jgi:hypothetical protein
MRIPKYLMLRCCRQCAPIAAQGCLDVLQRSRAPPLQLPPDTALQLVRNFLEVQVQGTFITERRLLYQLWQLIIEVSCSSTRACTPADAQWCAGPSWWCIEQMDTQRPADDVHCNRAGHCGFFS